jgi:UDP-N-acetylmuramate--alanine ligase
MLNSVDFSGRPFHFIGIGGIGMSALAYILAKRNLPVSGSDLRLSHITQRLQEEGAHIFWSQDATNLQYYCLRPDERSPLGRASTLCSESTAVAVAQQLPQVVCSTAIGTENPEYQAALDLGCPVFHRSDILAALTAEYRSILVAGTHGKTTTSSMVGSVLLDAQLDPTIVVGGEVTAWGGNALAGSGEYLVAEADESDGSLVKLRGQIGVITNIELDHPDHYTTLDEVVSIFQQFAQQCDTLVACIDSDTIPRSLQPDVTYSLDPNSQADYTATHVVYGADGTTADIWERGQRLGRLTLSVLGPHNLSNALATVAVGRLLGVPFATLADSLENFQGARRRFEHRGDAHGITFIDDYAHHPSEIEVTLAAARLRAKLPSGDRRRVVAVFQAHRYSRTEAFLQEFAAAFGNADLVVTTDIYSAGESNLGRVTGRMLAEAIATHHGNVQYQPTLPDVVHYLETQLMPGDLVLFLGAGNLNQVIPDLVRFYEDYVEPMQAAL